MGTIYIRTNEQGKIVHSDTNPIEASIQIEIEDELLEDIKILYCTYKDGRVTFDEEAYNKEQNQNEAIKAQETMLKTMMLKSSRAMFLSELPDEDAYTMRYLYDEWQPKIKYLVGDRRRYGDNLYKCKQEHTSEKGPNRTPDYLPALWDLIAPNDPTLGTKDNPIIIPEPFSSMEYIKGKYYSENDVVYLMNRPGMEDGETITLTNKPSQLVGHYFKVVERSELKPEPEEHPEWHAWDGVTSPCPWNKGKKCTHNGRKWESQVDNNVWEPGAQGVHDTIWKEIVE